MAGEKCAAGPGCELCGGVAAVHCAADSAFLCLSCDAKVHGANFLASRHLRRRLDAEEEEDGSTGSESGSSSCVSTADSYVAPRAAAAAVGRRRRGPEMLRARAEVVLEVWAKRMGLASGAARRRAAKAAGALRTLGRGVAAARVPLRVAMAAALWSEIAAAGCHGGGGDAALLRRLEASAHVPARLVVTVASWMARAATARRAYAAAAEEGWAECS